MSLDDHPINQLHKQGAPKIFEYEYQKILEKGVAWFERHSGRSLSPGQVEMLQLETLAYMISLVATQNQIAAENNLVAFADESWLGFIGEGRDRSRLPEKPAQTILRFSRAVGAVGGIAIPAGTRVKGAADGVVFLTLASTYLSDGVGQVDVVANASIAGQLGNSFAEGSINQLVDPLVGIEAVSNITETHSGTDRESLKNYRVRVAMGTERLGDGLSEERYVVDVLDWSTDCVDVDIQRPQAGYVSIYPLMRNGLPSDAERASLQGMFNSSNTHQGDFIQVLSPTAHEFSFTLNLKLSDPSAEALANAAVQKVLDDWEESLGGYVAPSALMHAAKDIEGVEDADIPDLAFASLADEAWRSCTGFSTNVEIV